MCYGEKPFELVWQEFDRRGEIITKCKSFRDKNSRDKFVLRLYDKDNFWQVLAYSEEGSAENYDD